LPSYKKEILLQKIKIKKMSEIYNAISSKELAVLRKSIASVSVLGALANDGKIDSTEKAGAVKLASQRTFTAKPILQDFYKEVDQHLENDFDAIINTLPKGDVEIQKDFLRNELNQVKPILEKLSIHFKKEYTGSQKSFAEHVFKTNASLLTSFFKSLDDDMDEKIFGEEEKTDI